MSAPGAVFDTYLEKDFFPDAPLALYAGVHTLDGAVPLHGHDFLEIAVVSGGSGQHRTVHGIHPVSGGDVFVLRPGAWHEFVQCEQLMVSNACISVTALADDISFLRNVPALHHLLWAGPIAPGRHGLIARHVAPERAAQAAEEIAMLEEQLAARANTVLMLGRLLAVLGNLIEDFDYQPRRFAKQPAAVVIVRELLHSAPAHPWRLNDLARRVNLDPAYLSRLFRQAIGVPPMGYLARIRAERAAQLLARSDAQVADIGAQVGWPDPAHFSRRFRALHGITPNEYRNRCQQQVTRIYR